MTQYDADPDATAVVLCETTYTHYEILNNAFAIVTNVKGCVKILKDEGKDYANVKLVYYTGDKSGRNRDNIQGIKATAYNMVDGKVEKTKMGNDLVFREQLDNSHAVIKFSVPRVQAGTVVEYQYEKVSENPCYIDTWYAHHSIPTAYCRYDLQLPEYFRFSIDQTGHDLSKMQQERKPTNMAFGYNGQRLECDATEYSYVCRDLPALKADKYVWNTTDMCNKVRAEFNSFVIPGVVNEQFTTTWEKIDELLLKDDGFGSLLKRSNPLKQAMTEAGIYDIEDVQERVSACFRLLCDKYRWNGDYRLYGRSMRQIEKDGGGSNADLNFILINMLRDAKVDAFPMLLSTRDHGLIPMTHPTLNAFNTFVVGIAQSESSVLFLDASARYGALNVLPSQMLSSQTRIIGSQTHLDGQWIDLQASSRGRTVMQLQGRLAADGTLSASLVSKYTGNDVLIPRRDFCEAEDSAAYVNENDLDVVYTSYRMEGKHAFSPVLTEEAEFQKQFDSTADLIYLDIGSLLPMTESPFKAESRSLPVEFSYAQSYSVSITIDIPEGYAVEELPKPGGVNFSDGDLTYTIRYAQSDNRLSVVCKFNAQRMFYLPDEYAELKAAFDLIADHSSATIAVKKNS